MEKQKLFGVACLLAAISIVACKVEDSYDDSPSPAPYSQPTTPSPTPTPSCLDVIYDMVDCISFLADGGSDDQPSDSCCSGFKSVLNVDGECICEAIQSSSQLGIELNMTRAAMLSPACGVDSFSISTCDVERPTSAPTPTPTPTPTPNPAPATPSTPTPNPPSPQAPSTPTTEPPGPSSSNTSLAEAPMSGSHFLAPSIFIGFIIFGLYA